MENIQEPSKVHYKQSTFPVYASGEGYLFSEVQKIVDRFFQATELNRKIVEIILVPKPCCVLDIIFKWTVENSKYEEELNKYNQYKEDCSMLKMYQERVNSYENNYYK